MTRRDRDEARRWLAERADPNEKFRYQQSRSDGSIFLPADLRPPAAAVSRGDFALRRK